MMTISDAEQRAILDVLAAGKEFGFGNMIAHLQTAWALLLKGTEGFNERTAREATEGQRGMPVLMQQDLILRGEWDETGARYRSVPKKRSKQPRKGAAVRRTRRSR